MTPKKEKETLAELALVLDERLAQLNGTLAELTEIMVRAHPLPSMNEPQREQRVEEDLLVCQDPRCSHEKAMHEPLSEKTCFISGCSCKGFRSVKRRAWLNLGRKR